MGRKTTVALFVSTACLVAPVTAATATATDATVTGDMHPGVARTDVTAVQVDEPAPIPPLPGLPFDLAKIGPTAAISGLVVVISLIAFFVATAKGAGFSSGKGKPVERPSGLNIRDGILRSVKKDRKSLHYSTFLENSARAVADNALAAECDKELLTTAENKIPAAAKVVMVPFSPASFTEETLLAKTAEAVNGIKPDTAGAYNDIGFALAETTESPAKGCVVGIMRYNPTNADPETARAAMLAELKIHFNGVADEGDVGDLNQKAHTAAIDRTTTGKVVKRDHDGYLYAIADAYGYAAPKSSANPLSDGYPTPGEALAEIQGIEENNPFFDALAKASSPKVGIAFYSDPNGRYAWALVTEKPASD